MDTDSGIGAQIVAQARSYIGVKYRHYGRNRFGVDCCGLVLAVAADLGVSAYIPEPYSKLVDPLAMRAQLERQMILIPKEEMQPGDSILLRCAGVPQHLGIWTGPTLIHAFEVRGAVVEVTWSGYWEQRFEAAFRWRLNAHG